MHGSHEPDQQIWFGFDAMLEEQQTTVFPPMEDEPLPMTANSLSGHHTTMLADEQNAATSPWREGSRGRG
jgi:hypothetical protein